MENYCVLMSVYAKDQPDQVRAAAGSMLEQSVRPAQFVLVSDGPLPEALRQCIRCIEGDCRQAGILFTPVPLSENLGLGPALSHGLKACQYELAARMDADDISLPDRCEKQLSYMESHPEVSVLSGTILEFQGAVPSREQYDSLTKKRVPLSPEEVRNSAPIRNPVNHPCVMLRKTAVLDAGGYRSVPYFEDYDLWLRMLYEPPFEATGALPSSGRPEDSTSSIPPAGSAAPAACVAQIAALPDPLLLMRTGGMYERRGGFQYAKHLLAFRHSMYTRGYISLPAHLATTSARLAVALIPPGIRRLIYHSFLRK